MIKTPNKSRGSQLMTGSVLPHFLLGMIFCVGALIIQPHPVVFAQSAAIGITTLSGLNQFDCSLGVDGIVGNDTITVDGLLYTRLQTLQGLAYVQIASDVKIQGDVFPTVIASVPAMLPTLLPFSLTPGDGHKFIWYGGINTAQTLACIVPAYVILDQTAPTIPQPNTPLGNSIVLDNDLVLSWSDAIDTGAGLNEYQIYISRDVSFPLNETYTFTTYGTSAALVVPLYLRGLQYRKIEATDFLGNKSTSNPWTFTYNPYNPNGGTDAGTPTTPPPVPATATCGNSVQEGSELCDDGNLINGDGCSATCTSEPTHYCGDGATNQAIEACDDGNIANGDGCSAQCQQELAPRCGDGIVNLPHELCDDGNAHNGDGCSTLCAYEPIIVPTSTCGNSIVEIGERCDDGNTSNADNCTTDCEPQYVEYCGNGIREKDEVCDDNNTVNGDGCSAQCQRELGAFCGDGIINQPSEACDDGNRSEADPCGNSCQSGGPLTCGDGIVQESEQCDDGNKKNKDGCSQRCTNETTLFGREDTLNNELPGKEDNPDVTQHQGTTDAIKVGIKPTVTNKPLVITQKLSTIDEFKKAQERALREKFSTDTPEGLTFDTQSEKNNPDHAAPYREVPLPRGGFSGSKTFTKISGIGILIFFGLAYDVDIYRAWYRLFLFKTPVLLHGHILFYRY